MPKRNTVKGTLACIAAITWAVCGMSGLVATFVQSALPQTPQPADSSKKTTQPKHPKKNKTSADASKTNDASNSGSGKGSGGTGTAGTNPPAKTAGNGPSATSPTTPAGPSVPASISKEALSQVPILGGDYIPCKFTAAELQSLHDPQSVLTLTAADAESLKQNVSREAMMAATNGQIPSDLSDNIIQAVVNEDFTGLTPSQALGRIVGVIGKSKRDYTPASPETSPAAKTIINQSNTLPSPSQDKLKAFALGARASLSPGDSAMLSELFNQVNELPSPTPANVKQITDKFLNSPQADVKTDVNSVVDSARQSLASLERPTDVGCAMSILSYKETSLAYGYIIAQNYIAVQVIVRNLNKDEEFLLHDIEFAVNTDPAGDPGRFFSGRDKVIVRALSAAQQNLDPRNISIQAAQGVGSLFSAIAPLVGGAMVAASGVINGAVVPSLEKTWKDQSKDQLNLLNDTGFSSSANSQTVVPKQGTVLLVTFIPSKQFTQGWWTQPCVNNVYVGTQSSAGGVVVPISSGLYSLDPEVGRALQACLAMLTAQAPDADGRSRHKRATPEAFLRLPVSPAISIAAISEARADDGTKYTVLTLASPISPAFNGDPARVQAVVGGKGVDSPFPILVVDPTHVKLDGTPLAGSYVAGSGTLTLSGNDIFQVRDNAV